MNGRNKQKGFALYLTVIAVGIVSFITFSLSDIAFRQNTIASIGNRSQQAFYASDSGLECALFWDLHHAAFPYNQGGSFDPNLVDCGDGVVDYEFTATADSATTLFDVDFTAINCVVEIKVEKVDIGDRITTKITSQGESGSCVAGDSNRFQRSIEVNY
ncbi:MAG: hypothetical protein MRY49_01990 [Candidatus Pacebacteria bacterium]|nr:hypothetical protein [Candidatus Paceibacterota bacterium]